MTPLPFFLQFFHIIVLVSGVVEQFEEVWHSPVYWQRTSENNNFFQLPDALNDFDINVKTRLTIARQITTLMYRLHMNTFIQDDFKADDVFIRLNQQVFLCLPTCTIKVVDFPPIPVCNNGRIRFTHSCPYILTQRAHDVIITSK